MKETTFPWTLTYDEIDYIIEGRLEILIDGRKVVGEAGDVILIPKNSKIDLVHLTMQNSYILYTLQTGLNYDIKKV